jgi:hypothetical protein
MTHCFANLHITGHLVFVLVSTKWVMMCPAIDNSIICIVCAIVCFLYAKNMSAVEIHHELCMAVYSWNVMSEGIVRQKGRMFKYGWTDVQDDEQSGWPSVGSDAIAQSVDQKICERQHFKISELSCEFPQSSYTVLYDIITVRLGNQSFVQDGFQKKFTCLHKM